MSRAPVRLRYSVRGIGVAESVSTSTISRMRFRCSFAATPNRCSSSMMTSPRSVNFTSRCSRRWVPISTSTFFCAARASDAACSAFVRNRLTISTATGNRPMRSRKVS